MKTLIIANPVAGGGRTRRLWPTLQNLLAPSFGLYEVAWSERPGDATRLARQAKKYQRVVACGGDGTIHEVANGLFSVPEEERPSLGCLSLGTGGDFIKSLGIPKNLRRQIAILINNREAKIDVGEITFGSDREKKIFLNVADAGMGAEVIRRLDRRLGQKLGYLSASLLTYLRRRPHWMEIRIEGKPAWSGQALLAVVANGRCFGGGMQIAPQADLQDGRFDLIVIKDLAPLWIPLTIALLYTRQLRRLPQVSLFRAAEVEINSPETVHLDIDGEPIGSLPVRFRILPRALRVIAP